MEQDSTSSPPPHNITYSFRFLTSHERMFENKGDSTETQNHGLSCESQPLMRGGGDEDLTAFLLPNGGGGGGGILLSFSCT